MMNDEPAYMLNEAQTVFLAMVAETKVAEAIRSDMVKVILAMRHGNRVPPTPNLDALLRPWPR